MHKVMSTKKKKESETKQEQYCVCITIPWTIFYSFGAFNPNPNPSIFHIHYPPSLILMSTEHEEFDKDLNFPSLVIAVVVPNLVLLVLLYYCAFRFSVSFFCFCLLVSVFHTLIW